jgi:transposase
MRAALLAALLAVAPAAAQAAASGGPVWDQARATALAQELARAADALYDAFYKQPQPPLTPRSRRDYERLKQDLRRIENEARGLAAKLARGGGPEETRPAFEYLMVTVRWAGERARSVFTTRDVEERAAAVGALLDQLAPLYGAEAPAGR